MRRRFAVHALAAAAALLALAGCSASPAPRLYVLSAPAASGTSADLAGIALGIGPVTLAPHLDRPQIVSRRGSEIHLAELDRWAEPLADGIARALAENLGEALPAASLWLHPWPPPVRVDVRVALEVLRFDDGGGGDGVLVARWTLAGAGAVLASGRFEHREPAASAGPAATVEALGRALAELGREVAGALAQNAPPGG